MEELYNLPKLPFMEQYTAQIKNYDIKTCTCISKQLDKFIDKKEMIFRVNIKVNLYKIIHNYNQTVDYYNNYYQLISTMCQKPILTNLLMNKINERIDSIYPTPDVKNLINKMENNIRTIKRRIELLKDIIFYVKEL